MGTGAPPTERARRAAAKVVEEAAADPRPIAGYAGLLATYGAGSVALVALLRRRARGFRGLRPLDLLLYGLATEHLSRLVTKDAVTSVLRFPFTRFEGTAGAGEVNEKVVAHGVGHAVGEMLTCPFCVAQWIATGLVAGSIAAPALTSAVVSVSAVARLSDYLQFLWSYAEDKAG